MYKMRILTCGSPIPCQSYLLYCNKQIQANMYVYIYINNIFMGLQIYGISSWFEKIA